MVETGQLRSVDRLMYAAVSETVAKLDLCEEDVAATRLALHYAETIDEASEKARAAILKSVGPLLLNVLESLGATPRARAIAGKSAPSAGPSKLQQLRLARSS